jgi:hypothetical protein
MLLPKIRRYKGKKPLSLKSLPRKKPRRQRRFRKISLILGNLCAIGRKKP